MTEKNMIISELLNYLEKNIQNIKYGINMLQDVT